MNTPKSFEDLQLEYAMLIRRNRTLEFLNRYYQAKNYSVMRRNAFLVKANRALYILVAILLLYIAGSVVVGSFVM